MPVSQPEDYILVDAVLGSHDVWASDRTYDLRRLSLECLDLVLLQLFVAKSSSSSLLQVRADVRRMFRCRLSASGGYKAKM